MTSHLNHLEPLSGSELFRKQLWKTRNNLWKTAIMCSLPVENLCISMAKVKARNKGKLTPMFLVSKLKRLKKIMDALS
jgi:hypothetical protein